MLKNNNSQRETASHGERKMKINNGNHVAWNSMKSQNMNTKNQTFQTHIENYRIVSRIEYTYMREIYESLRSAPLIFIKYSPCTTQFSQTFLFDFRFFRLEISLQTIKTRQSVSRGRHQLCQRTKSLIK